jgi:hypothetical protein
MTFETLSHDMQLNEQTIISAHQGGHYFQGKSGRAGIDLTGPCSR